MEVIDRNIEREDLELNHSHVTYLKAISKTAIFLGVFFMSSSFGGLIASISITLTHFRRIGNGSDRTFDWEPFMLFFIGSILAFFCGFYIFQLGKKLKNDLLDFRNITDTTIAKFVLGIQFIAIFFAFMTIYISFLLIKHGFN